MLNDELSIRATFADEQAYLKRRQGRPPGFSMAPIARADLLQTVVQQVSDDTTSADEVARTMQQMMRDSLRRAATPAERIAAKYQLNKSYSLEKFRGLAESLTPRRGVLTEVERRHAERDFAALHQTLEMALANPTYLREKDAPKRLLDEIGSFLCRHGVSTFMRGDRLPLDLASLDTLAELRYGIETVYGRQVVTDMAAVITPLTEQALIPRDYRSVDSYLAFEEAQVKFDAQPSLQHWQSLQQSASRVRLFHLISGERNLHTLGAVSFLLDSSTTLFGLRLARVKGYEHARRADAQLADQMAQALIADEENALKRQGRAKRQATAKLGVRAPKPSGALRKNETVAPRASESIAPRKNEIDAHISALLQSSHAPTRFEGEAAEFVRRNLDAFAEVVATNVVIARGGQKYAEIDVMLDEALIECTLNTHGKNQQIQRRLRDPAINPLGLPVILFAPNYADAHIASLPKEAYIARSQDALADILFALKARARQRAAGPAGHIRWLSERGGTLLKASPRQAV